MSGYVKKIAVIKQLKGGFSADGGNLSGLVKAETYAGFLKVEVSLINFAPLTEGRYVFGISDGLNTATFESATYEGESAINLSDGFAFLVCFCHNGAAPIAGASCGQMACALPDLKDEMKRRENVKPAKGGAAYDDDAVAGVNYYAEQTAADEGGNAVRENKIEEKKRTAIRKNAAGAGTVAGNKKQGEVARARGGAATPKLAGGDFYMRMKGEIERIFTTYPREPEIENALEGSRFARISYGEGRYYVFGVLTVDGAPRYVCYGIPARGSEEPPPSLKGCATYLPTANGGYFITYQDAATGVSVKLVAR